MMSETNSVRMDLAFGVWWVLVSVLGGCVGLFAGSTIVWILGLVPHEIPGSIWSGAVFGAFVGVMQFFVLRTRLTGANGWIWVHVVGWTVGLGLELSLSQHVRGIWASVVTMFIVSLSVGGMQGLFLRRRFYRTGWWVLVNALGWGIGVVLRFAPGPSMVTHGDIFFDVISPLVGGVVIGGVGGVTSGVVMIQLLRCSRSRM